MNVIPMVIIAVPFALGAWFWWIMRGSVGNRKANTLRKSLHIQQNVGNGVETCERGAIRADRQTTEKEVAEEFDFLRQLRKREADYKPSGTIQVSITNG